MGGKNHAFVVSTATTADVLMLPKQPVSSLVESSGGRVALSKVSLESLYSIFTQMLPKAKYNSLREPDKNKH